MLQRFATVLSAAGLAMTVACSQSDSGITTAVKTKLAADVIVKDSEINVDTGRNIVTLNGTVDIPAAKERAVMIARDTKGVVQVVDDIVVDRGGRPLRLRLVAALSDSLFQGELLMSERRFVRAFPEWEGYRFFLADVPPDRAGALTTLLESRLSDFGVDVASTMERLAGFHRVEYTYLSTFQTLGGLGLVLGTLGLGAILLRNVLERRRELALLRALGYTPSSFFVMVVAENVFLLAGGLLVGATSALVAIAPVFLDRGGRLPALTLALLLAGVLGTGLLASIGATAAALRAPLLSALRTE
jgi:hypothetical protein